MAGKRIRDLAAIAIIMGALILTAMLMPILMGPSSPGNFRTTSAKEKRISDTEVELELQAIFTQSIQVTDDRITPARSERDEELTLNIVSLERVADYKAKGYGVKWIKPVEISFHYIFDDNGWTAHDNGHEWKIWVMDHYVDGLYLTGQDEGDRHYDLALGEFSTTILRVRVYVMAKAEWHTAKAWTIVRDVAVKLVVRMEQGYQEPGEGNGSGSSGSDQSQIATLRVFVSYYYYQAGARQAADGAIVRLYDASGSLVAEKVATKYDDERALAEFENLPFGDYEVKVETDLGSTSTSVAVNENPEEIQVDIPCGLSWIVVAATASVAGLALLALLVVKLATRRGVRKR